MGKASISLALITFLSFLSTGCLGPSTPLGSIDSLLPIKKYRLASSAYKGDKIYIRFQPNRQIFHKSFPLSIDVKDFLTFSETKQLKVLYNGIDVTDKFNKTLENTHGLGYAIGLKSDKFRLPAGQQHNLQVHYLKGGEEIFVQPFLPPTCHLQAEGEIHNTDTFDVTSNIHSLITSKSKASNFNPNFLAGVVAQESGFNPNVVSISKAIGLTQVTSLAESEIIGQFPAWPRYPRLNDKSYLTIKKMIYSGEVNAETEWRLNPEKSILGGVAYVEYLNSYWERPKNRDRIQKLTGNFKDNHGRVLMASYNSGAARVKYAMDQLQDNWFKSEKLQEAYKYYQKVSSYCFQFSQLGSLNE